MPYIVCVWYSVDMGRREGWKDGREGRVLLKSLFAHGVSLVLGLCLGEGRKEDLCAKQTPLSRENANARGLW